MGKLKMWFPNRSDTNRPVQAQKQARSLKFWIYKGRRIVLSVFAYADCWFSHEVAHMLGNLGWWTHENKCIGVHLVKLYKSFMVSYFSPSFYCTCLQQGAMQYRSPNFHLSVRPSTFTSKF